MNPKYVPRDYMTACIEAVFESFKESWSVLVVMATGVGKTEAYLQIAERFLDENDGKKVLTLAHREELISQPAKRWYRNVGAYPAIEMGRFKSGSEEGFWQDAQRDDRHIIGTTQTLNSGRRCNKCTADCRTCGTTGKVEIACPDCSESHEGEPSTWEADCETCDGLGKVKQKCKLCKGDGWLCVEADCQVCFEHFCLRMQKFNATEFGLVIIDEAHHATSETYTRIVRYFRSKNPNVKLLGLTATPDRADEEALGQVFQVVAYVYNLPDPINDGWLTPIEQQFVTVDDLNLSNIRTTAGDLNEGDLQREMMAEKMLHKVTTPIVEIACGLPEGTIDGLINENRVADIKALCTRREPTLIHAAGVSHAERMTEIINRYLPDSAACVIGTTDKELRPDLINRFGAGEFQFMLSCGVFLEGTDLPNVSMIGMARPTKSRALYAQMLGRGLRPLSGLIDGVATPEERKALIAASAKPFCKVIDFVGNSGRHKLVSVADVLGDAFPDELVDQVKRKAVTLGQPLDMLRELQRLREEQEQQRKEKARADAAKRAVEEERRKKQASERRAGIVAGATYSTQQIDPFAIFDILPGREPGYHKGRMPTEGQLDYLRKAGIEIPPEASFWDCQQLCDEVTRRRKENLCTFKQAKKLKEWGFADADTWTFQKANLMIGAKIKPYDYQAETMLMIEEAKSTEALTEIAFELRMVQPVLSEKVYTNIVAAGKAKRATLPKE